MGYESRIFVMNRKIIKSEKPEIEDYIYAEMLAEINMCCMETTFPKLFQTPIDFDIFGENDAFLTLDKYGKRCNYAEFAPVIEWLKEDIKQSDYRRLKPLLAYLEAFDPAQWNELILVHYGY